MEKIIERLQSSQVFRLTPGREHKTFPKFKSNMLAALDTSKLNEWIKDRLEMVMLCMNVH